MGNRRRCVRCMCEKGKGSVRAGWGKALWGLVRLCSNAGMLGWARPRRLEPAARQPLPLKLFSEGHRHPEPMQRTWAHAWFFSALSTLCPDFFRALCLPWRQVRRRRGRCASGALRHGQPHVERVPRQKLRGRGHLFSGARWGRPGGCTQWCEVMAAILCRRWPILTEAARVAALLS